MLMFIALSWLIMLQIKNCGAMVKDLNLQRGGWGVQVLTYTCNLGLIKLFA